MWGFLNFRLDFSSFKTFKLKINLSDFSHVWLWTMVHSVVFSFRSVILVEILCVSMEAIVQGCTVVRSVLFDVLTLYFNTLRLRRNEHFADDIFKRIFFNENVWISIKISMKFVLKGSINNIPALVQIMAWRRSGDKPLSEPMMVSLPTHICVTRPQWVNTLHAELF